GRLIPQAPTTIVQDPLQRGAAVTNGISCMSCHAEGIILKRDQVREAVKNNPLAYTDDELEAVLRLYKDSSEFRRKQLEDRERFLKALKELDALDNVGGDPIVQLSRTFEEEVDKELAAAEVGLDPNAFVRKLDSIPELGRILGTLKI